MAELTKDELIEIVSKAYSWYIQDYAIFPHKDTRHGGDQVVSAFAAGMLSERLGRELITKDNVDIKNAQMSIAPKGTMT